MIAEVEKRYADVSLESVHNENEARVLEQLPVVLEEFKGFEPDYLDIQDIFALALNQLPACYAQRMSIRLGAVVEDSAVREALRRAVDIVWDRPSY